jgi:hypothetical protein
MMISLRFRCYFIEQVFKYIPKSSYGPNKILYQLTRYLLSVHTFKNSSPEAESQEDKYGQLTAEKSPPAALWDILEHSAQLTFQSTRVNCTCSVCFRFNSALAEPVFLNVYRGQESIIRNRFRQPMQPGGPIRKPYSYSVPSPHRLFRNTSSVLKGTFLVIIQKH